MDSEKVAFLREALAPENQHELVALARALCPFADRATDATMLLCIALVEAKGDEAAVCEALSFNLAGLRRHCQSRLAAQIMRKLAKDRLLATGYVKAMAALEDVAGSASQSGNARRQAALAIAEIERSEAAVGGNQGDGGIDLNAMTLGQLESYVAAIKQDLIRLPANPPPALPEE